jgi:hypothetical protein
MFTGLEFDDATVLPDGVTGVPRLLQERNVLLPSSKAQLLVSFF